MSFLLSGAVTTLNGHQHKATMLPTAHTPVRLLPVIAGLGLLACQSGDLTLPADLSPASLHVVSGNGQRGTVGTQLPEPLVVRVTDAANQPVPNVNLRFETEAPAAKIDRPLIATNDTGVAAVQVWLGSTEGVQTVEASLAEADALKTTFALIAVPSRPHDEGDEDDDGRGSAGDGDGGKGKGGDRGRGRGNEDGGDDDD